MLHTFIFDLDGTTVDSSHRLGETLADWRRMNTPANIMKDKPLPLAEQLRQAIRDGLDCVCLLYTSPSPRDQRGSRMPSSA